jgi:hypothetical protein
MVIHDMRNPTNSIEFALKEILKMVISLDPQGDSHQKIDKSENNCRSPNFKVRCIKVDVPPIFNKASSSPPCNAIINQ